MSENTSFKKASELIPIELQYYDKEIKNWCEFIKISHQVGRNEQKDRVYDFEQLPEKMHGRYLFNNDRKANVWFYIDAEKTSLRVKDTSTNKSGLKFVKK